MATMVKLLDKTDEIVDETYNRIKDAEESRPLEFKCVLKIQAWFRGQRVRSYLQFLEKCALQIQRRWRGHQGRAKYREHLKQQVFIMKLNHYNSMATKIQKTWRGYYTRKYVSNYYSRKRYLDGLVVKNEMIRAELEGFAEQQEFAEKIKQEKLEKQKEDKWAEKNHHLISTVVMPGVYKNPYRMYPDQREMLLRNAGQSMGKEPSKSNIIYDPGCTRYDLPELAPLPPIQQKPQGPFKDPRAVQKQRYKQFQPSLRVDTNYYSLEEAREAMKAEEWVTRLNDNVFQPFSRRSVPYESLLHSTSKYGHLPYGTKYFNDTAKLPNDKDFKLVAPPIPVFDKLNDTYSQGQDDGFSHPVNMRTKTLEPLNV